MNAHVVGRLAEKDDFLLLLQLLVDVFQDVLAELVWVDLGERRSADAFILSFES